MKFYHRWVATALFIVASNLPTLVHAAAVSGQGTWEGTLQGRDLDGNLSTAEAYYDTSLNITWLADANYAGTTMNWANANAWAAGLDPYGSGITGWRLPITVDANNDGFTYTNFYQGMDWGYNITTHSEMSHMFYVTLGDKAYFDTSGNYPQPGFGPTNTGPFSNVQAYNYWSATQVAPDPSIAWLFAFDVGGQGADSKAIGYFAWAVHSGDVGTTVVTVPAAVWLFGSGLVGLIGFARRRKK